MDKQLESKILTMLPLLNEKQKRIYLATEAMAIGRGGIKKLSALTGVSQTTIIKGKKEVLSGEIPDNASIRSSGSGRKKIETSQSGILETIERPVSNHTFENPENPLRWTTKSLRNIAKQLNEQGFKVISFQTVQRLLKEIGSVCKSIGNFYTMALQILIATNKSSI